VPNLYGHGERKQGKFLQKMGNSFLKLLAGYAVPDWWPENSSGWMCGMTFTAHLQAA